jgi:hypothetical protein
MVSSRKKGKTIHSEYRVMMNHVNYHCKQEAVKKSLILPICRAGKRTVNYYGVLVPAVKWIRRESRQRNCAVLKPYIFDQVHVPQTMSAHTAKVKDFS